MVGYAGYRGYLVPIASLLGVLVLWEILVGYVHVIEPYLLPPPSDILSALAMLLGTESFIGHIRATLVRTFLASIIASVPGVILGLAMGWSRTVKALVFPIVSATYPLPKVALLPLFMLVFGIGDRAFILTTGLAATFLVMFNSMRGVADIGNLYFEVAQDNEVNSVYTYFKEILLPGALPMIFTGLRLTLNTALLVMIAVEFVAARQGLGAFIWTRWSTLQTDQMYAAVLVVSLVGVLITYGLAWAADYTMPWKSDTGTTAAG